jgi:hypothetical protein
MSMTTNTDRQSAQIIAFPARGRFAAAAHRETPKPASSSALAPVAKVAVSSGWYHDAAIQDERARQH